MMTEYANSESTVDDHTEVRCRQIAVFFNEYGNLIHIEVSGVADNQLRIVVRGPSSESENIVTRAEAERLRLVLNDFLGPSKMKTISGTMGMNATAHTESPYDPCISRRGYMWGLDWISHRSRLLHATIGP
jgi:hypothetical protein